MDGRIELWLGGVGQPVWRAIPQAEVCEVVSRVATDTLPASAQANHPCSALRYFARSADPMLAVLQAASETQGRLVVFGFSDHVVIPPPAGPVGLRRISLLSRRPHTTLEQFRQGWNGRHAQLVKHLPGCIGYVQSLLTPMGEGSLPIDGIAQLYFEDEEQMKAAYASSARDALREDARELLGQIATFRVVKIEAV